jgi:hypothetical protein
MGIVVTQVVFDGQAPELSSIAGKVAELSGLPLSVTDSGADVKAGLYDLHAYLAFACHPETPLRLHSYRAGAVKELYHQTFGEARRPIAKCVQGLNEAPGTQTVYLHGYVGQEPTLLFVTELALEALGGRPRTPMAEEVRRDYGADHRGAIGSASSEGAQPGAGNSPCRRPVASGAPPVVVRWVRDGRCPDALAPLERV